jgi:peptidoglycan/LPS O-acetylase OafA/YrhL
MEGRRFEYVDGLRGMAVLWVVAYHAWYYPFETSSPLHADVLPRFLAPVIGLGGYQGVSLFLVLSGFCLSYPLWSARQRGRTRWFVPSEFFARRCLRILPPYYAALLLYGALDLAATGRMRQMLTGFSSPPTLGNGLSHLVLVQNMTGFASDIDGPMWSLGLEWQWYLLFPFVLALIARSRVAGLTVTALLVVLYHAGLHDLWGMGQQGMVPQRLFEFACGVVVAHRVAHGRSHPRAVLVLAVLVAPWLVLGLRVNAYWLQPLANGLGFSALLLLAHESPAVQRALSWRPLAALGVVSYSVYLIHEPVLQTVEYCLFPLLHGSGWLWFAGMGAGIAASLPFYLVIERACTSKGARARWVPRLARWFRWADTVWLSGAIPGPARAGRGQGGAVAGAESQAG